MRTVGMGAKKPDTAASLLEKRIEELEKENKQLKCQTADYLGRFPQIISDGNTCHSLRSMRQKHIISGVTADYRGLISVQLWLD